MFFRKISAEVEVPKSAVEKIIKETVHKTPPSESGGDTVGKVPVHKSLVLWTPEDIVDM